MSPNIEGQLRFLDLAPFQGRQHCGIDVCASPAVPIWIPEAPIPFSSGLAQHCSNYHRARAKRRPSGPKHPHPPWTAMAVDGQVWSDPRTVLIDTTSPGVPVRPLMRWRYVSHTVDVTGWVVWEHRSPTCFVVFCPVLHLVGRFGCPVRNCLSAVHVICCRNCIAPLLPFVRLSTCVVRRPIAGKINDEKYRTASEGNTGKFL